MEAAALAHGAERRFWWVNQNQTHRDEIAGGFMWSPKRNANDARNPFYDNMARVSRGDVVFSFYGTRIQHIGVVTSAAETAPKPAFASGGENWSAEGWLVGVEFAPVTNAFRPKDFIDTIRPLLPDRYSPLQATGDGLQQVYLAEISEDLANLLASLAASVLPDTPPPVDPDSPQLVAEEEAVLTEIEGRTDIGDVERTQLVKARRGQGIFRTNVRMNESRCRVTGVDDLAHLRASHIKPWRDCDDLEKLHGCNGLLLAPHIDHLFDRGWISFDGDGTLLIADGTNLHVLAAWGIEEGFNGGPFSEQQQAFLGYHRAHVFRGANYRQELALR
jgi:putative restriction endonuclease